MSTTADLVTTLKAELKAARMTYADLAKSLGMAESSVKRMLARADMPLSRVDAICRVLKIDFAELARKVADGEQILIGITAPLGASTVMRSSAVSSMAALKSRQKRLSTSV